MSVAVSREWLGEEQPVWNTWKKKGATEDSHVCRMSAWKGLCYRKFAGVSRKQCAEECLTPQPPAVSFNKVDQNGLLRHTPDQPEKPKIIKISIIRAPNAGKSTLFNKLLGRKLFWCPLKCTLLAAKRRVSLQ